MNKVWAYPISKLLSEKELNDLLTTGFDFISEWTAHNKKLKASFEIFENRILLVKVDESFEIASGCSIDKLTQFIKKTELSFGIELLNRFLVACVINKKIEVIHATEIKKLLLTNVISENTFVYNTSISNQNELNGWLNEIKNTWLKRYLVAG